MSDPKPTAMMHKSIDLKWNKSPLDQGRIDIGTENIRCKMINWPDEDRMKATIAKMVLSTTGHDIEKAVNPDLAEELFHGGLQTGLEGFSFSFEVSGISRQLTHEIVRTRKAVFHQQSMRHTDMGDNFNVRMPQTIADACKAPLCSASLGGPSWFDPMNHAAKCPAGIYLRLVSVARDAYAQLKAADLPYQDCRTVCPIGTETYIVCTYPVSEFLAVYSYRACRMFLWEMQHLMKLMREEVLKVFPWMEKFIKVSCEKTKRCMYQGWEDTTKDCEFPYAGDRVYKPNLALIGLKGKAYGDEK